MDLNQEIFKTVLRTIKTWVVEVFWPWFVKHIWPEIRKHVLDVAMVAIANMAETIKNWFISKNSQKQHENLRKQEEVKKKAEAAAEKAKQAQSVEEAEKYRITTEIWEEVLEDLKIQNTQLREELDELRELLKDSIKSAKKDIEEKIATEPPEHLHIPEKINEQIILLGKVK